MKKERNLIDYIALSFIDFIDYMLKKRDAAYLKTISYTGKDNQTELINAKHKILKVINPSKKDNVRNIIKEWSLIVGIDYSSYNLVPLIRLLTNRVIDLKEQTKLSRKTLIDGMLSFKYETHQLTLTKTIENEGVFRELLRELAIKLDKEAVLLILEQSKAMQSAFIQYFEGVLKETSAELKVFNTQLEQKVEEKNRELLYTLYTDKLTGIANSNAFLKDIETCEDKNIVLFNIDGFRKINSVYGYTFADEVLKTVIEKLNHRILTCGNYKLYRYHGDWFIILETNKNQNSIEDIYSRLLEVFSQESLVVKEEKLNLSFTAGVSKGLDNPIKYAELAYHKAKENRSLYEVYDDENSNILEEYKKHQHILKTIHNAIKKDLVIPHFQLIRDNKNPQNKKYESLMRIEGPFGQIFSPYIFMDIAKDAKLYTFLSRIMMRKTIEYFEHKDATFSLNLEVEDVLNPKSMDYLYELIQKHKVEKKLIIEITESEDIEDFQEVAKIFKRFKEQGVKVAIDDFGTGYSNFSYLMEFDFDFIKIDGSLIKNIHQDENAYIITSMIIDFAKKLGKQVIAEFIDNDEVQKVIEKLGIDFSQGYLFSKPTPSLA